jgi:hypothetical protein
MRRISSHPWGSVGFSPTGYRFGFASPIRLVRFGFVWGTGSSLSVALSDVGAF